MINSNYAKDLEYSLNKFNNLAKNKPNIGNAPVTTNRSQLEMFSPISSTRDLLVSTSHRKITDKKTGQACGDWAIHTDVEYEKVYDIDEYPVSIGVLNRAKTFMQNKSIIHEPSPLDLPVEGDANSYYIEPREQIEDLSNINERTKITGGDVKMDEEIMEYMTNKLNSLEKDETFNGLDLNLNIQKLPQKISLDDANKIPPIVESVKDQEYTHKTLGTKVYEKVCRVCLESEIKPDTGEFISPCKCQGTVKYIHQECLKKWILAGSMSIDKAKCELCQTTFLLDIERRSNLCRHRKCTKKEYQLFILLGVLFLLVYVLLHLMVIMVLQM